MSENLLQAISNEYKSNQRARRYKIRAFAEGYFARAALGEFALWKSLYEDKPLGPKVHSALRSYLTQRTNRCAYCQDRIFHNANVNIDHILPKSIFPHFTFTDDNLVAACVTCNAIKSDDDFYGVTTIEMNYDNHKPNWTSFHPRHHLYDDHIRMISVQTNYFYVRAFVGKTPEGSNLCNLFLNKVTDFGTKAQANSKIAQAVVSLENLLAASGGVQVPAVQKLLANLVTNI